MQKQITYQFFMRPSTGFSARNLWNMKKWKKYLESLNDISEIDNVIEKAAALKHQDLYKIACEIKQSKL